MNWLEFIGYLPSNRPLNATPWHFDGALHPELGALPSLRDISILGCMLWAAGTCGLLLVDTNDSLIANELARVHRVSAVKPPPKRHTVAFRRRFASRTWRSTKLKGHLDIKLSDMSRRNLRASC